VTFTLHPDIKVQLRRIGHEAQPLMVVDNVLADPEAMINAAQRADFYVPEHTKYPGRNAPLPEGYYQTVVTALRGPIEAAFGLPRDVWVKFFGFFALATTPADQAEPIQKIPHHDTVDPGRLALVHYLCRGDFGGTGFFRHKSTGFESVDAAREAAYVAAAKPELEAASLRGYADAGMANYELAGEAEMVFNRLIIYRTHVLHSGLLGRGPLSHDPAIGRLTANGFIEMMKAP
jgi:hypothetical protein